MGVVQGGPSSGELFIIFLNSLPIESIPTMKKEMEKNATSNQFVDDLNSVVTGNNEEELRINIQKEFNRIQEFLRDHKMQINSSKTQLMYLNPSASQKDNPLLIDETLIPHQKSIKTLGMTLASNLKWDEHIKNGGKNMIRSINSKAAMIRSIKSYIPQNALSMAANNLVNSTIVYGAPLWATTSLTNKDMLQRSQIKAARMVTGIKWSKGNKLHRQQILDKINWPNVEQIAQAATLNLVKRALCKKKLLKLLTTCSPS